jgi:hypothetical protein
MAHVVTQADAAHPFLEALDDGLLLRVIDIMISDNSARRGVPHDAQRPEPAWHPAHLARLACVSRCVGACSSAAGGARTADALTQATRRCSLLSLSARRRFRALVTAHGWRAAAQRHFRSTAARLISAAAALQRRAAAAAAAAATAALVPPAAAAVPTPPEWRALYKLLTCVPWTVVSPGLQDVVERLRECAPLWRGAAQHAC